MIGGIGDTARIAGAPQQVGIEEAARAFEALFLEKLLEFGNRPIAGVDLPMGGGSAERSYRQLFLQEIASRAAQRSVTDASDRAGASPFGLAAKVVQAASRAEVPGPGFDDEELKP